jgi:hypothetical protein
MPLQTKKFALPLIILCCPVDRNSDKAGRHQINYVSPGEVVEHFIGRLLPQTQFGRGLPGGNILNQDHLDNFLKSLSVGLMAMLPWDRRRVQRYYFVNTL